MYSEQRLRKQHENVIKQTHGKFDIYEWNNPTLFNSILTRYYQAFNINYKDHNITIFVNQTTGDTFFLGIGFVKTKNAQDGITPEHAIRWDDKTDWFKLPDKHCVIPINCDITIDYNNKIIITKQDKPIRMPGFKVYYV